LSEEVIVDSSDDEEAKGMEAEESYTPKGLPKYLEVEESTTPKYTPNKSYTPKALSKYMSKTDFGMNSDSELGTKDELEDVSPSKMTV
jgi:hypothetical protein